MEKGKYKEEHKKVNHKPEGIHYNNFYIYIFFFAYNIYLFSSVNF